MKELKDCKLFIVDDEPELLQMVGEILRREGFTRIFSASSCTEAVELFPKIQPDCAILDIMLPDGDGFELLRQMRSTSTLPVLFLSARDEDEDRLLGLGLGADDYIVKPFLPRELILRLTAILRRVYFPPVMQEAPKPVFQLGSRQVDFNNACVLHFDEDGGEIRTPLTAKEFTLLEKLYGNKGRIVTSDSLCRAAWGDALYGYENTLTVHIRRLREKLEESPSDPQYLLTIRGLGYKLTTDEDDK